MYHFIHKGSTINYTLSDNNIHIQDSYLITNESDMIDILKRIKVHADVNKKNYKRSLTSWLNEWKTHNLLYNIGIAKDRTGSVDINDDAIFLARAAYTILSIFYISK